MITTTIMISTSVKPLEEDLLIFIRTMFGLL